MLPCHDRDMSRPQYPSSKWRYLVQMGKKTCHDRDTFRDQRHRTKMLWPIPKQFGLKCRYPFANGRKDARTCFGADLTKEPPRGPFAHELRNQTGGNYVERQYRHVVVCSRQHHIMII